MSNPESKKLNAVSVHGRFQPMHNGHLEYVLAAFEKAEFVYVGITQIRSKELARVDDGEDALHRAQPQSNPLTYFERAALIRNVLEASGLSPARFQIIPFPIETPADLDQFLPTEIPVLTTTYDGWNERKIELLRGVGYTVENLWSRPSKAFEGKRVRELMRSSDDRWKEMVPDEAARALVALEIPGRLQHLVPSGIVEETG